jgi:hypothetical protein
VRPAADQEWDHNKVRACRRLNKRLDRRIIVQEGRENLRRNPAPTQHVGETKRGGTALRVPLGSMAHQSHRRRATIDAVLAHQLREAPGDERSNAGVGSNCWCLPEPELRAAPIPR